MTVAQLISKLQKMPQDSIVTVFNDKLYVEGEYEATGIETYDCKTISIITDYKNIINY